MTGTNLIEDESGKGAEVEMRRQRRNLFLISGMLAIVQLGNLTINLVTPDKQLFSAIAFKVGHPFEIGHWVVWMMFGYTVWLFLVYLRRIGARHQFAEEYRLRIGELFKKQFRVSIETDPEFTGRPMFQEKDLDWTVCKWQVHDNTMVEMEISPKAGDGSGAVSMLSNTSILFRRDITAKKFCAQKIKAVIYVGVVTHAFLEYVFPLLIALLAAVVPLIISLTR